MFFSVNVISNDCKSPVERKNVYPKYSTQFFNEINEVSTIHLYFSVIFILHFRGKQ